MRRTPSACSGICLRHSDDPRSGIVDALSTTVVDGTQVKVLAWYDNEWGYSCRVRDLINYMGSKGL